MRSLFYYIFSVIISLQLFVVCAHAQQLKLGNNPTYINPSAVLQLDSKDQGLLLTRVPDTCTMTALNPPEGMIIYFTDSINSCVIGAINPNPDPHAGVYERKNDQWQLLTGITSLNGSTVPVQAFDTGRAGNNFNIVTNTATGVHTFNLPDASPTARGAINTGSQSIAGTKKFDRSPIDSVLHNGSIVFINDTLAEDNNNLYWDNKNKRLGVGTNAPQTTLDANGTFKLGQSLGNGTNAVFHNMFSYTIANANISLSAALLGLTLLNNGTLKVISYTVPGVIANAYIIVNPGSDFTQGLVISWVRASAPNTVKVGVTYVGAALSLLSPPVTYTGSLNFLVIQ